jgi:putative Mn2+ efflux pump MntP
MGMLLLLGFTLSLDSFRVSLTLGAMKLTRARQAQIALAFAVCDGLAPLVGLLLGQSLVRYVGAWVEYLGPLMLGLYGCYVLYVARRYRDTEATEQDHWLVFGIPLSLSLDNLVAGASLGLIGFPLLLSVVVIGAISGLMSLAGLRVGSAAVEYLPIRAELLGGVALICIALALALEMI